MPRNSAGLDLDAQQPWGEGLQSGTKSQPARKPRNPWRIVGSGPLPDEQLAQVWGLACLHACVI